ncbi:sensor histidine kinase [Streptacidiphilus monticola]|uniref:histidine kinase n=1 Tax=Streptacidiphilus monticola TaxID=2161674 RepID=A0ABW1G4H5_9ACTN
MRRLLRPVRTLRERLIAGLLALLVVTCAGVGFATVGFVEHFLVQGVDQRLADNGVRYPLSLEHGGDTRAVSPGTFGARLSGGQVTVCGLVDGDADDTRTTDTDDVPKLSDADRAALAALTPGGSGRSVELSSLGWYRLRAFAGRDRDVLVTGAPLRGVKETVDRVVRVELLIFAVAFATTAVAGWLWVRFALRPLDRVVATATRVSGLPLATGAVALSERVPDEDPDTEVGRVGLALNRLLGHVGDALAKRHSVEERLRGFAADASHELRTPVAAVRGHAELALRHPGPVPDPVRHSLRRIDAESQRMGAIVDDLLLLARLDAGRPLAAEEVDLTRLVLDAVTDARAAGPGHRWQLELPEEPVLVLGDADRLRQVLANLLANARSHTPEGTSVTVSVGQEGDRVRLAVADTGPGIAAELLPQVFQRFVRGDRGRARATGSTGLGLSIVQAVVTAHGGAVEVSSAPGRTVFTVTLSAV